MAPAYTVLVVDDDEDIRELAAEVVDRMGHRALQAPNGGAALVLLDEHPEISVLLTDVVMPGMSGQELVARALQSLPHLRILMTSGCVSGPPLERVPFLAKPWRLSDLRRVLSALL
jgi:CheY-like chemotaxis protein